MRNDIRNRYDQLLNESHSGYPTVMHVEQTGRRGRPRIVIDPEFLAFAHQHRSTAGIARFLGVGVSVVRNSLLRYGIAQPGQDPFPIPIEFDNNGDGFEESAIPEAENTNLFNSEDDIFDPNLPRDLPPSILQIYRIPTQTSTGLSTLSDEELDALVISLRVHYRRAGISMLTGMLQQLGHRVSRNRLRNSLLRVDPIQRTFQRITIRRRVYSVPGPNALWHHDGQHGQIPLTEKNLNKNSISIIRSNSIWHCHPWIY